MNEKMYHSKNQLPTPSPFASFATPDASDSAMVSRYISNLSLAPGVVLLISSTGIMDEGSVRSASDFSYSAPIYAGNGFRIVGDAGGEP